MKSRALRQRTAAAVAAAAGAKSARQTRALRQSAPATKTMTSIVRMRRLSLRSGAQPLRSYGVRRHPQGATDATAVRPMTKMSSTRSSIRAVRRQPVAAQNVTVKCARSTAVRSRPMRASAPRAAAAALPRAKRTATIVPRDRRPRRERHMPTTTSTSSSARARLPRYTSMSGLTWRDAPHRTSGVRRPLSRKLVRAAASGRNARAVILRSGRQCNDARRKSAKSTSIANDRSEAEVNAARAGPDPDANLCVARAPRVRR